MSDPTARWPEMITPLIALLRPIPAPLNIGFAAVQLDLRVIQHDFQGPTRAAALGGNTIVLDSGLGPQAAAASFAHEIAHIMLQRDIFHVLRAHEELFADWLGREICLPRAWLRSSVNAPLTARRYRVPYATVAVQLAGLGRAPALQRLDNAVLCAICGPLEHNIDCSCNRWRRLPPPRARCFPTFVSIRPGDNRRCPAPSSRLLNSLTRGH
jgi:IrrE N-terminal-like domain